MQNPTEDEAFVRQLCVKQQVPLHTVHFDTALTAEERHISIEMAATRLRYGWFEEIRQKINADAIAVAHHQDDSVETPAEPDTWYGHQRVTGNTPQKRAHRTSVALPGTQRNHQYLNRIGQDYVTDSTNLQDEYTRNKIRLNLLPMMQEINPSVKESILNTAEHLDGASAIYKQGIDEGIKRVRTAEASASRD